MKQQTLGWSDLPVIILIIIAVLISCSGCGHVSKDYLSTGAPCSGDYLTGQTMGDMK